MTERGFPSCDLCKDRRCVYPAMITEIISGEVGYLCVLDVTGRADDLAETDSVFSRFDDKTQVALAADELAREQFGFSGQLKVGEHPTDRASFQRFVAKLMSGDIDENGSSE